MVLSIAKKPSDLSPEDRDAVLGLVSTLVRDSNSLTTRALQPLTLPTDVKLPDVGNQFSKSIIDALSNLVPPGIPSSSTRRLLQAAMGNISMSAKSFASPTLAKIYHSAKQIPTIALGSRLPGEAALKLRAAGITIYAKRVTLSSLVAPLFPALPVLIDLPPSTHAGVGLHTHSPAKISFPKASALIESLNSSKNLQKFEAHGLPNTVISQELVVDLAVVSWTDSVYRPTFDSSYTRASSTVDIEMRVPGTHTALEVEFADLADSVFVILPLHNDSRLAGSRLSPPFGLGPTVDFEGTRTQELCFHTKHKDHTSSGRHLISSTTSAVDTSRLAGHGFSEYCPKCSVWNTSVAQWDHAPNPEIDMLKLYDHVVYCRSKRLSGKFDAQSMTVRTRAPSLHVQAYCVHVY